MSLGVGDVMTALDLCADAVLLACGQPLLPRGRFYDLGNLKTMQGKLAAPPDIKVWVDQSLKHPD